MKIYQLLLVVIVIAYSSSDELPLDGSHGTDFSLGDLFQSAGDIASGLIQAFGNQLSADYFFNFVGNLVLGFPLQLGTVVTSTICE